MKNLLSILFTYLIYQLAFVVSKLYPHVPGIFWTSAIISFVFLITTWGGLLEISKDIEHSHPNTSKKDKLKITLKCFALIGLFGLSVIKIPVSQNWLSPEALAHQIKKAEEASVVLEIEKQKTRSELAGKVVIQPFYDISYYYAKIQWPVVGVPGMPMKFNNISPLVFNDHKACNEYINNSWRYNKKSMAYCTQDILK